MKLILSSCDFGNPVSARAICDNLGRPIGKCRVPVSGTGVGR